MTQEEKFEEAKRLYETANADQRYVLESLFPELKESEDERIRKEITEFFKNFSKTGTWNAIPNVKNWIEWLEKQGEQKPKKCMYSNDNYTDEERKVLCDGCKEECELRQKPAWSEEDEEILTEIILSFERDTIKLEHEFSFYISWLKSIKDRIQPQPKQEWSEDDKRILKEVISNYESAYLPPVLERERLLKGLKSLRPQNMWKPSDEQMVALDGICSYIRNKADWEISQDMVSDLYKLSEQLKKLREE